MKIIATFCENSPILRNFDLFLPLCPQIWLDQKEIFVSRDRPGVWATFARPGGGYSPPPPPRELETKKDSDKR